MSEMPASGLERLHDALIQFTGCIGNALEDICSYGLTIGEEYVPFDPDPEDECDDEEVQCSQAWVRVVSVVATKLSESFDGSDCASTLALELEVGVIRCVPIEEDGEAPKASDVLIAALQAMTDMNTIHCAAFGCEVWESLSAGQWVPFGPLGGQHGGTWSFTAEI